MTIKIFKPAKTAMQSGRGKTKQWLAEYVSDISTTKDTLMGWTSSSDTRNQIKIFFETKEQAIKWAKNNNYQFFVEEPQTRNIKPKSYSANFDMKRKEPWTH